MKQSCLLNTQQTRLQWNNDHIFMLFFKVILLAKLILLLLTDWGISNVCAVLHSSFYKIGLHVFPQLLSPAALWYHCVRNAVFSFFVFHSEWCKNQEVLLCSVAFEVKFIYISLKMCNNKVRDSKVNVWCPDKQWSLSLQYVMINEVLIFHLRWPQSICSSFHLQISPVSGLLALLRTRPI